MRWRILALLFFARVGSGFQFQTLGSVGDNLVVAFGLDWSEIGLLIGLFMFPGLFLSLPAGYLGRFISDRSMVIFGLGALTLGGIIAAAAPGVWAIGIGRIFAGTGFLFVTLYGTKMIADWFDGREAATAMSILVMSWPFGIAMGQIGHAWLAEVYNWRVPFQVAAVYCLTAAILVYAFYRAPPDMLEKNASATTNLTAPEWRLILCAAGAWSLFNAAYVIYLSFGPRLLEHIGQSELASALIISLGSWVMILSGAVCGLIADRFGQRSTILGVCMIGAIVSLLMLGWSGYGIAASLLFGLVGMAPAGIIMAMAGQALRPQARAFGMGIFFSVYYAVMMVAPPAAGALLDATGGPQSAIWLAMLLFALVIPFAFAYQFFNSAKAPAKTSDT